MNIHLKHIDSKKYIKLCHTQGIIGYITKIIDYINILELPIDSFINNYLLYIIYG